MKVTYNWLKEFVDIKITPGQLADKLTMAGLEVKSLEEKGKDYVFEIEITSNRPDWLSVLGVAREIAAITNSAYIVERIAYRRNKEIKLSAIRYPLPAKTLKIEVEDKRDCPLYTARIIKNTQVSPSPDWLSKRLELIGCRSINNVVDITNYILFTFGEPLHAFDLDKLLRVVSLKDFSDQLNISIRRAVKGEKIITIDGVERELDADVLVIAAGANKGPAKAVAIAGIMGGKETEVGPETKNILLEAAVFDPLIIRRSRQKLGLQTDSSYRFERGVDFETVEKSSEYAVKLINEISCGIEKYKILS
ncbi:MAG: phenylalanine--tRNA ligase beta subunit-related protein, partial [Candidatus Omnitrophota bacterium]